MIPKICNHQGPMFLKRPEMLSFQRHVSTRACALLFSVSLFGIGLTIARADAVSELESFSIFHKVDLSHLDTRDVKTAHGPSMKNPRFLAVHSCYVASRSPC